MAEYSIRFTEQHLVATLSRFREQAKSRYWVLPLKLLCLIGLGSLIVLLAFKGIVVPSVLLGLFLVLLALGPRIDYWFMKRRFRRSPFYNSDLRISIGPSGFVSTDSKSRVELSWSAFTKVRRFSDGFLVFSGPQQFYWWPDALLNMGTVSEVESLLRGNVPAYDSA